MALEKCSDIFTQKDDKDWTSQAIWEFFGVILYRLKNGSCHKPALICRRLYIFQQQQQSEGWTS